VSLHALYEKYHDRIQFLLVYIREAHPVDGWWLGKGVAAQMLKARKSRAALDIYDPKTTEERQTVAGRCETELAYGIPTCVDEIDDAVSSAYAAIPTRLYLVGLDGLVAYAGGMGPFGFKPAELGKAIEKYLSQMDESFS